MSTAQETKIKIRARYFTDHGYARAVVDAGGHYLFWADGQYAAQKATRLCADWQEVDAEVARILAEAQATYALKKDTIERIPPDEVRTIAEYPDGAVKVAIAYRYSGGQASAWVNIIQVPQGMIPALFPNGHRPADNLYTPPCETWAEVMAHVERGLLCLREAADRAHTLLRNKPADYNKTLRCETLKYTLAIQYIATPDGVLAHISIVDAPPLTRAYGNPRTIFRDMDGHDNLYATTPPRATWNEVQEDVQALIANAALTVKRECELSKTVPAEYTIALP